MAVGEQSQTESMVIEREKYDSLYKLVMHIGLSRTHFVHLRRLRPTQSSLFTRSLLARDLLLPGIPFSKTPFTPQRPIHNCCASCHSLPAELFQFIALGLGLFSQDTLSPIHYVEFRYQECHCGQ